MTSTLNLINKLISNADPDDYESISYNKYFRDLSSISDSVISDANADKDRNLKMLAEVQKLPDSEIKASLIKLCLQDVIEIL